MLTALVSTESTRAASLASATLITRAPTASRHPRNAPRDSTTQTTRASAYGHATLAGMTVTLHPPSQSGRRRKGAPLSRRRSLTENQLRSCQMGLSVLEVQKECTLPSRTPMTVASTMSVLTELTRRTQDALLGRCSIQPSSSVTCQPMSMDVRTITILRQRRRKRSWLLAWGQT